MKRDDSSVARLRASSWTTDLTMLTCGAWTLLCQLMVNSGATAVLLIQATSIVAGLVGLVLVGLTIRMGPTGLLRALVDTAEPSLPPAPAPSPGRRERAVPWVLLGAGLTLLWMYHRHRHEDQLALWAAPLFLAMLLWSFLRDPAGANPRPITTGHEWALWPVALALGAFTMCARRPDVDEAFYLAVATSILRNPDLPVLSFDPVHGVLDWPLQIAAYRSHTFEPLAGVLAKLTGAAPIKLTHVVFAGLAGALAPFAWMRLFRELWPARAVLCTLLTLLVIVSDGSSNQAYGNFAMVRMYQGKAILLTVLLPLVATYTIRLVRQPTRKRWLLAIAAHITATGLSSIAIPLAPLVAGVAAIAAVPREGALRRLLAALCACLYPLILGGMFYAEILGSHGVERLAEVAGKAAEAAVSGGSASAAKVLLLDKVFTRVLSNADIRWAYLVALMALPIVGRTPVLRRWAATCGLVFFGVLANPYLQDVIAGHLFGGSTYWRIFWLVPLPAFVATAAVSAASLTKLTPNDHLRALAATGLVLWVATTMPNRATFGRRNHVRLGMPGIKVKSGYYAARRVSELAAPKTGVVAPRDVNAWLGAFPKPVYATFVKRSYLRRRNEGGRGRLSRCFEQPKKRGCSRRFMRSRLNKLKVGAVVMRKRRRRPEDSRHWALRKAHFESRGRVGRYDIWVKKGDF